MAPIITLLTDFGIEDGYVASMKGVILGICPGASLVDISHMIPPQDVRAGAYVMFTAYKYFPAGTVHLAVVDPGVGTERRALVLKAGGQYFVGPDNGLFSLVLKACPDWSARSLENSAYWRSEISNTFHGRDIFAPAAAHLARGLPIESLGPPSGVVTPPWGSIIQSKNSLRGQVMHIDHFGNIISNFNRAEIERFAAAERLSITLGSHSVNRFANTYGEVEAGKLLFLFGSSGYLEVAMNQGDAAEALGVRTGDPAVVHFHGSS
ncbi:MAG: SAM-dependent chlorinase/fluorinase [Desulfoferrobacter sp.]